MYPSRYYWLAAALLAVTLFAPALSLAHPSATGDIALAARLGAELGALASAGAGPPPTAAPPPPTATAPPPTETPPPPTATPTPVPRKEKLIFVDPGHGGQDVGAVHTAADGAVDLTEAEANLSIALRLAELLRQHGYDVALSREVDSFVIPGAWDGVELQARVDMANEAGADLYISIHNNGSESPAICGTEVWYCGHRGFAVDNARLAALVQQALVRNVRAAGYDTQDRGAKDDISMGHFAVLGPHMARPSRMPGIIGESLFLSNDHDAAALARDDIRDAIARGYLEGIEAYFDGQ